MYSSSFEVIKCRKSLILRKLDFFQALRVAQNNYIYISLFFYSSRKVKIDYNFMQNKQTNQKDHKEQEVDSESCFMPILHIPTKDQRKLLQNSAPPEKNPSIQKKQNEQKQKMVQQTQWLRKRGPRRRKVQTEKHEDKEEVIQKVDKTYEVKRVKREIIKKDVKKQAQSIKQNCITTMVPKSSKRGRPRKGLKIEPPQPQNLQNYLISNKQDRLSPQRKDSKQQKIAQQQKKGSDIQIQQPESKDQKHNKQIKLEVKIKQKGPIKSQVANKKQTTKQKNRQVNQVKLEKENKKTKKPRQPSDSSSSDSDSSDSHQRRKTKKIKLKLTNFEKMQIYKNRYIICRRKLKQNFFQYKKCPRHHLMRNLVHDSDKSAYRLVCQKCNKDLERNCLVYWQCDPCRYLVCGKCQGYNWKRCPYGHPTMRSQHFRGQKTCDICLQQRYIGGLTCPCNFDMCGNCELKAKKYNQNGEDVISLQQSQE